MAKTDLTAQRLRDVLNYDPKTGNFVWRIRLGGRRLEGQSAGIVNKAIGYVVIGIDGFRYYAHRLAWLHMFGVWPDLQIDHIDGNRANNAICNLRNVTAHTNMQNLRKPPITSSTGLIGACVIKGSGKFQSGIRIDGKRVSLGVFDTPQDAHAAYIEAKRRLHAGCTI